MPSTRYGLMPLSTASPARTGTSAPSQSPAYPHSVAQIKCRRSTKRRCITIPDLIGSLTWTHYLSTHRQHRIPGVGIVGHHEVRSSPKSNDGTTNTPQAIAKNQATSSVLLRCSLDKHGSGEVRHF